MVGGWDRVGMVVTVVSWIYQHNAAAAVIVSNIFTIVLIIIVLFIHTFSTHAIFY